MKLFLFLLFISLTFKINFAQTDTDFSAIPEIRNPEAAEIAGLTVELLDSLINKPLFEFTPTEVEKYIAYLHIVEPDLRKRIQHLAKKNLGQPYEIYLLGEYPFEIYDDEPLYSLDKSDCVVFSEHTYAMALSKNWKQFFAMLQRIRYKDGVIGMLTRNHYTEADWTNNNSWLITDITNEIAKGKTNKVKTKINRAAFFSKFNIGKDIPVQYIEWEYIPADKIEDVLKTLKTGDFVNVVRGYEPAEPWVGHVGLVSVEYDGTVNFIHSTEPEVKIQTMMSYVENQLELTEKRKKENPEIDKKNAKIREDNKKLRAGNNGEPHPDEQPLLRKNPYFYGLKFFRLNEDALERLKKIDGQYAPRVTIYGSESN